MTNENTFRAIVSKLAPRPTRPEISSANLAEAIESSRPINPGHPITSAVNARNRSVTEYHQRKGRKEYAKQTKLWEFQNEMSEVLELDWMIFIRLLLSGEYHRLTVQDILSTHFHSFTRLAINDKGEVSDEAIDSQGYFLPIPKNFPPVIDNLSEVEKYRTRLVKYWLTAPTAECRYLRERYTKTNVATLDAQTYQELIIRNILKHLETQRRKKGHELLREHQIITRTTGIEAEIPPQPNVMRQKLTGVALGAAGVPVTLEPSTRVAQEVSLPKSTSPREQLAALQELYKMGMIGKDQQIMLHITYDKLGEIIDEDTFLFFEGMIMADLMNTSSMLRTYKFDSNAYRSQKELSDGEWTGRKHLFANKDYFVKGFPFRQREDGSLEFRFPHFLGGKPSNFTENPLTLSKLVRDTAAVSALHAALVGYRQFQNGEQNETTEKLAVAWSTYRSKLHSIQHRYCPDVESFHENYHDVLQMFAQRTNTDNYESFLRAGSFGEDFRIIILQLITNEDGVNGKNKDMTTQTLQALDELKTAVRKALFPGNQRLMATSRLAMNGFD